MIQDILIWPNKVLDNPATPVVEIDDEIQALADDLIDTCELIGGVGLAAPQIGVPLQVFVIDIGRATGTGEKYETFINPVQVQARGAVKMSEGCLSLPGIRAKVDRYEEFGIEYTTLEGTRENISSDGVLGQALQHEMDHVNGKVLVEKMSRIKRPGVRQKMKILKRRMKAAGLTYHDVIRMPEE
jgi:peptide deformylase